MSTECKTILPLIPYFLVNCGDPENPRNGSVDIPPHTRENASVMYRCDDGFRPSANFSSTCANTTLWTPEPQDLLCTYVEGNNTMKPPIRGPPRKGQPPNRRHTSGPLFNSSSSFLTPRRGQPLNGGQNN